MKTKFMQWFANQVHSKLASGKEVRELKVDISMSLIKYTSANYVLFAYNCSIQYTPDIIYNGFSKNGNMDVS